MKLMDYLHLPPFEGLVEAINTQYVINLLAPATQLTAFEINELDPCRIRVRLDTNRSVSDANMDKVLTPLHFTYRRIDLGTFFTDAPGVVLEGVYPPFSVDDVVHALTDKTGVCFTHDDLEANSFDTLSPDGIYTITASPTSLRWCGEFKIQLDTTKVALSEQLTTTRLPEALGWANTTGGVAAFKLMAQDFTADREHLSWLKENDTRLPGDRLLQILKKHNHLPWTLVGNIRAYNLTWEVVQGDAGNVFPVYKVVYNGPVRREWTPVTDRRYVLVMAINEEYGYNLAGVVLFHYN